MLKLKALPILMRIASKIDLKPITAALNGINFNEAKTAAEAQAALTERKVEVGFAVLEAITPQLDKVGDDVVELIAAYNGVSVAEAGELDAIAELKKLATDAGVVDFFKSALQRKATTQK